MTNARKFFGQPEPFYRTHSKEVMIGFNTDVSIVEKFTDKFPEKFTENETQRKIIKMMLENPKINRNAIAVEIGITTRGVQKSINALKAAGLVERIGSAKGGYWKVNG